MGRVSVVIPTTARPDVLEVTLRAVSRQVSRDLIDEVIVSENLGDASSRDACDKFPELPIRFVLREPQLTWSLHAQTLLREARSEFVAFCCDDDVWAPGHIATGVEALDAHQSAGSFFSAAATGESELSQRMSTWCAPLLWLAAGSPPRMSQYVLDRRAMLAIGWMFCPFKWSTLIARSDVGAKAAEVLTREPIPYWADCDFELALSREADVVFEPGIDMMYRQGSRYWEKLGYDPRERDATFQASRVEVLEEAKSLDIDLPAFWRAALTDLPPEIVEQTGWWFRGRFSMKELESYGFLELLPPDPRRTLVHRVGGRLARAWKVLKTGSTD